MTQIAKWGNSLGLRIPQNIAAQVGLSEGTPVVLEISDGKLIIKPKRKKYSLVKLLESITPENIHPETDTGKAVGNEI
jgi:antitoxin MazE